MDDYVPRARDVPALTLAHVTHATSDNPLGIISVGESEPNSPPAAIAAAVEDVREGRLEINALPVSPEAIARACRA